MAATVRKDNKGDEMEEKRNRKQVDDKRVGGVKSRRSKWVWEAGGC